MRNLEKNMSFILNNKSKNAKQNDQIKRMRNDDATGTILYPKKRENRLSTSTLI